jgi:tetratricopeptide (TPR) repeat protein
MKAMTRRRAAQAVVVLAACATATAQASSLPITAEREAAKAYEPAALSVARGRRAPIETLRVRFYADEDYRAGGGRWQERVRGELDSMNRALEPALAIRLEAESFRRWNRKAPPGQLGPMLEELETFDAGADVDWVVGLVSALPLVSSSIHELGMARTLGRHFILRGMSSVQEFDSFCQGFPVLAHTERHELEELYSRRKQHKETVVFLHEWAHTLGAPHARDERRIMAAGYTHLSGAFDEFESALLAAGLGDRLQARREGTLKWTALGAFVAQPSDSWPTGTREELVALLGHGGAKAGTGAPASGPAGDGFTAGEAELYNRALAQAKAQKPEAATAAREVGALVGKQPGVRAEVWLAMARLYHQVGGVSWAEEALGRAGAADEVGRERAALGRARRTLGLPVASPGFVIAPAAEPAYVELAQHALALLAENKLDEARAANAETLRRFPRAPGALTIACELGLRQGRGRRATKDCTAALAITDALPRAHYLLGHTRLEAGDVTGAIPSLKRAIALEPDERGPWDDLAAAYRFLGRQKELRALLIDAAERVQK